MFSTLNRHQDRHQPGSGAASGSPGSPLPCVSPPPRAAAYLGCRSDSSRQTWRGSRASATIEDPVVIRKILTHLGFPTEVPAPPAAAVWPVRLELSPSAGALVAAPICTHGPSFPTDPPIAFAECGSIASQGRASANIPRSAEWRLVRRPRGPTHAPLL